MHGQQATADAERHIRLDMGRRVELVSMDAHCRDISIGLYVAESPDGPVATVHTYSSLPGAAERVRFVARAMAVLGGLDLVEEDGTRVRFPCGTWHAGAGKRLFLEACKQDPSAPLEPRPMEVPDTRTEQRITIVPLGDGAYRVQAVGAPEGERNRAPAIARALVKLAELEPSPDDETVVTMPCGRAHDPLMSLVLQRAQNLRAVLREEEMKASRGVLSAPSAQE